MPKSAPVLSADCFVFGLATAPAHVEDQLNDSWLDFARATKPGLNPDTNLPTPLNVPAWHNVPVPEERVRFWTDAETEIKLAAETGIKMYRLGVDWGRLVSEEPLKGTNAVVRGSNPPPRALWVHGCHDLVDGEDVGAYWSLSSTAATFLLGWIWQQEEATEHVMKCSMRQNAGVEQIQALRVIVSPPYPPLTEQLLEASIPCILQHVLSGEGCLIWKQILKSVWLP
jgi:hypothetical protein